MPALQASDLSAFPMMGALLTMMGSGQEFQSPDIKFASAPQASTTGAAPAATGTGKGAGAAPGPEAGATNAAQGLGIAQPNTASGDGSNFASIMAENLSLFLGGGFGDQGGPGNPGGGQPGSAARGQSGISLDAGSLAGRGVAAAVGQMAGSAFGPVGLAMNALGYAASQGWLGPSFGNQIEGFNVDAMGRVGGVGTTSGQQLGDALAKSSQTSDVKNKDLSANTLAALAGGGIDAGPDQSSNPDAMGAALGVSGPGDVAGGGGGFTGGGGYGADIGGGSSRGSEGGGSGEP